jgi:hypothetical protein
MIIAPRRRKSRRKSGPDGEATESGLQTHPLLTLLFSLRLPLDFGLVCKNCAIRGRFFDSVRACHDFSRALAQLFHVRRVVLFDNRNRIAESLRDVVRARTLQQHVDGEGVPEYATKAEAEAALAKALKTFGNNPDHKFTIVEE